MRFKVIGADAQTGVEQVLMVTAPNREFAEKAVRAKGFYVGRVERVDSAWWAGIKAFAKKNPVALLAIFGSIGFWCLVMGGCAITATALVISGLSSPEYVHKDQLPLACVAVEARWQGQYGQGGSMLGSGSVIARQKGKLRVVTNRHVLALQDLAAAAGSRRPRVQNYDLEVEFTTGQRRRVGRFADAEDQIDLVMLEVDGEGLTEGKDYVIVPISTHSWDVGDSVVAVGHPEGYGWTQTFGHVSYRRTKSGVSKTWDEVQTDAAVNPGNSGGPLFQQEADRYFWIGINTYGITQSGGSEGVNFAISSRHLSNWAFYWYPADRTGAAMLVRNRYRSDTEVQ